MDTSAARIQFIVSSLWYWLQHLPARGFRLLNAVVMESWNNPTLDNSGQKQNNSKTRVLTMPASSLTRVIIRTLEFLAVTEILQILWVVFAQTRKLTEDEINALREVAPSSRMPYHLIRVSEDSLFCRINGGRAVATMHIIHLPADRHSLDLMVHEIGHCAQFQIEGAIYMAEALHAQFKGGGYDYGDLDALKASGRTFLELNREQQAQVLQDYYRHKNGKRAYYGCTAESAQPFVDEFRELIA